MGQIIKTLEVKGDKGKEKVEVFFDSGASASLIRRDFAEKVCATFTKIDPVVFRGFDGKKATTVDTVCNPAIVVGKKSYIHMYHVVDEMPRSIIVGVDFMQRWEMKLDLKTESFTFGVDPQGIEII